MALVVEDNTGLSNAESYVDVATFRAYAAARGVEAVADLADDECEAALRTGFSYINNNWRWKASPLHNDQRGEFPRVNLSDGMGRVFNVVPQRVKDAQCEAAILSGGGIDLFVVAERGGAIHSEAVGPLSTSYFQGAPAETFFQAIERMICVFAKGDEPYMPLPSFNDPEVADPVFSVGMDDNSEHG